MSVVKLGKNGNKGSIRVTIPKKIVDDLELNKYTHVSIKKETPKKIVLVPLGLILLNGGDDE